MRLILAALFLLVSCQTPGEQRDPAELAIAVFRVVGDAVLRVDGLAALKKYAPEAVMLIDQDADGVVTLAEVEAAAGAIAGNPEFAAGVLAAAYLLRRSRD